MQSITKTPSHTHHLLPHWTIDTSLMKIAFQLNNLGVSFLNVGAFDKAQEAFKAAVDLMKCYTSDKNDREVQKASRKIIDKWRLHCEAETPKILELPSMPEESCFVAKVAFEIPEAITLSVASKGLADAWESAILLHNLALSLHCTGLQSGALTPLSKALKVYELSKKLVTACLDSRIHTEQTPWETEASHALKTQLVMSLLNNMGQIHHQMQEYELARHYFDGLSSVLSTRISPFLQAHCPDINTYYLNAMLLQQPKVAPAA